MKKLIRLLKKYIYCNHNYLCVFVHHNTAKWRCKKCGKRKNGYAPIFRFLDEYEENRKYFKENF